VRARQHCGDLTGCRMRGTADGEVDLAEAQGAREEWKRPTHLRTVDRRTHYHAAMHRAAPLFLVFALAWGLTGCFRPSPATMPSADVAYVAVLSGEMPGSFRDIARHSWIVSSLPQAVLVTKTPSRRSNDPARSAARRSSSLRRYEWVGDAHATSLASVDAAFSSDVSVGDVAVHGVKTGSASEIAEIVACLERETEKYKDFNCGCWPGPNSNTFADLLIRTCGLGIELPATAIGKDYRGPIGASITEGQTGVQLQTWLGGAKIGLKEGIQADLTGLSLGVHFWPPGFEVPVNPGRIGVDRSKVRPRDATRPEPFRWNEAESLDHRLGAASLAMLATYSHVRMPSAANGLSDRMVVGLTGRAVYGRKVGYAFGFDGELGVAAPLGFAYRTHLLPVGVGVLLGDLGFAAVLSGIGTSGVSSSVTASLELPQEARVELDLVRLARIVLRGGFVVVPDGAGDRGTLETFVGTSARLGTRASGRDSLGAGGGGFFFGLERRELLRTYWLGLTFGYELGVGG